MTAAPHIEVRGGASAEELAAVVMIVTRADAEPVQPAYERWRLTRLAAVRRARTS